MIGGKRPDSRRPTDPRYRTARWQKVRLAVLRRDRWACQVEPGCPYPASVCDHVTPVVIGVTTDAAFFDPSGLRGSCRAHNLARPVLDATAAALRGEELPEAPPLRGPYSYGSRAGPTTRPALDTGRHPFAYHRHPMPDGPPYLVGDMSVRPRWDGPGCPPECPLPKPATTPAGAHMILPSAPERRVIARGVRPYNRRCGQGPRES